MKIAFFCSSGSVVPPPKTGGVEWAVFYLIRELAKRGHKVTLYAAPGSNIKGVRVKEISPFSTFVKQKYDNLQERITSFYDLTALAKFFHSGEANNFDVIIFASYIFYEILPFSERTKTPIIIKINYPHKEIYPSLKNSLRQFKNIYYLPDSKFIKNMMPDLPYLEPLYPVFDIKDFNFSEKKGEYLLFIGRICPDKGTHLAVQVAIKAKMKLVIAGEISESHKDYFNKTIRPYIDNDRIIYVGEVDFKTKVKIYQKAVATLFTSLWDEPFGMVQLESMDCGTPVVTFDKSATREIVKNGISGYITKTGDVAEMAKAVNKAIKLDRKKVRQYVENKFSIEKEADKFEKICQKLIKTKK